MGREWGFVMWVIIVLVSVLGYDVGCHVGQNMFARAQGITNSQTAQKAVGEWGGGFFHYH